jgi:hypothetical protein
MPSDGQDRQMLHTVAPVLASGADLYRAMLQEVSVAVRDAGARCGGIIDCTSRTRPAAPLGATKWGLC